MKTTITTINDFCFKGALQITNNLLILFVELDFIHSDEKYLTLVYD